MLYRLEKTEFVLAPRLRSSHQRTPRSPFPCLPLPYTLNLCRSRSLRVLMVGVSYDNVPIADIGGLCTEFHAQYTAPESCY